MKRSLLIVLVILFGCNNQSKRTIDSIEENVEKDIIEQFNKEDKALNIEEDESNQVLFETRFENLKFTIEDKDNLYVIAYDSSNNVIDELNINHPYYKSSIFGKTSFEILQKHKSTIQMMFYSQYGGDGEHTREKAKFIFFNKNKLELIDEIVVFKPQISRYDNRVSILGYYIISLCDVCDGWDASEEDDIFKIPMNIELKEGINYYGVLHGEEKEFVIKDFEKKVNQKIESYLSKNDSTILRTMNQAKKEFYNIVNEN